MAHIVEGLGGPGSHRYLKTWREATYNIATLREMADSVRGSLIPRLYDFRRVPACCQRILPLTVMKQYQCIVVGTEHSILTVGITNRHDTRVIDFLRRLTGRTIFPVLIDPARMRLLLHRIERNEEYRRRLSYSSYLYRFQVPSVAVFLEYRRNYHK